MASASPTVNAEIFYRRIARVYNAWEEQIKVDAIVVPVGQYDESVQCESLSIQEWLFNREIPDLLMVFARDSIVFLATEQTIDFLRPLLTNKDGLPEVTLLTRDEEDEDEDNFKKILSTIKSNGTNLGTFPKDNPIFSGDFYQECMQNIFKPENSLTTQDVTSNLAVVMAIDEDTEQQDIQKASAATKAASSDSESEDSDEERKDSDEERENSDDGRKDSDEEREDSDEEREEPASNTIYDFDIMMAKKKEENSRKRKRRGYDIINDNDDIIADIISQMRDAVESDVEANKNKLVATSKLKLLPFLVNQLRKVDLRDAFLDSDVLSVITDWLAPLPDRSLPHLNIRENLLKILIDFSLYDVDRIKSSGIGKAIMYLYKHPKETKENKKRCKQLISAWSRPIFDLDTSFSSISREEREERDKELQKRASRVVDSSDGQGTSQAPKRAKETEQQTAKNPGDKGWIPRARVPAPSMRDYVIRPRSKVDGDIGKGSKRPTNVLEKLMRTHQERRRANKQQRAINMKIDKL